MRTAGLTQRYFGMYLADVVDVNDPKGLGRVRVKAEQYEDSGSDPVWASVGRPAAGDHTGVFFTPKVGDQVVIAYVVGDVHEPLVIGYAHSQQRPAPPETSTTTHGIVTTVGSVTFDEKEGRIEVNFAGAIPSKITMDATGVTINTGGKLNVTAQSVHFDLPGAQPTFCVGGQGVVREGFLSTYDAHTHAISSAPGTSGPPVPPSTPDEGTGC